MRSRSWRGEALTASQAWHASGEEEVSDQLELRSCFHRGAVPRADVGDTLESRPQRNRFPAGVGLLLPIAARGPAYATSRPATSWRAITTMSFSQAKRRSRSSRTRDGRISSGGHRAGRSCWWLLSQEDDSAACLPTSGRAASGADPRPPSITAPASTRTGVLARRLLVVQMRERPAEAVQAPDDEGVAGA